MAEPQIRYETNELRLLFELCQTLEGMDELAGHLEGALGLMARYTGMMRGAVALLEPGGGDIALEAAYGLKGAELEKARYKPGEGVSGRVIESGRPMLVAKASEEAHFLNSPGARDLSKEEISFICVPIMVDNKAVGTLSADRLFADSVRPEEDARLLQVLASLIARAVKVRLNFQAMHSAVVEENRRLQQMVRGRFHADNVVASSAAMRAVMEELAQVAHSGSTVLLRGESGTGKELAASIIHSNSPRAGRPFIKVNCAALPEGLMDGELFGYEHGTFGGAAPSRKGRFEMAHGGTLFLDEVGDMTPLTQAKLLRVLQEREFERVGGGETLRADVRLVAASNRNLEEMVAQGKFRQDLYYRLSVFPIHLPPLRERRDDIMALITHFVESMAQANGFRIERITTPAANMLLNYEWPGNIRELQNVIERAVILGGAGGVIEPHHLPAWMQDGEPGRGQSLIDTSGKLDEALARLEKRIIMDALADCGGNMSKAARRLGISERIMGLRMKKYKIDYKAFRRLDSLGA